MCAYSPIDENGKRTGKLKSRFTYPFHAACYLADQDTVEHYLKSGVNPNVKTPFGRTPLHEVCSGKSCSNSLSVVQLLVSYGADPMAIDDMGDTPLHSCVIHHYLVDIMRHLIVECCVPIRPLTVYGLTPMDYLKESLYTMLQKIEHSTSSVERKRLEDGLPEMYIQFCLHDNPSQISLRDGCREIIRERLEPYSHEKVDLLPLPQPLKCLIGGINYVNWIKNNRIDVTLKIRNTKRSSRNSDHKSSTRKNCNTM